VVLAVAVSRALVFLVVVVVLAVIGLMFLVSPRVAAVLLSLL
tara:strand:- start:233 stop:358 length:126 start_codon:yes stop_codon:yes gene_type:complete